MKKNETKGKRVTMCVCVERVKVVWVTKKPRKKQTDNKGCRIR